MIKTIFHISFHFLIKGITYGNANSVNQIFVKIVINHHLGSNIKNMCVQDCDISIVEFIISRSLTNHHTAKNIVKHKSKRNSK